MNKTNLLLTAAVAGIFAAGVATTASADGGKCYGIAKAGQNACASASGSHACKGQAKKDREPDDFVLESAESCALDGGSTTAPASK